MFYGTGYSHENNTVLLLALWYTELQAIEYRIVCEARSFSHTVIELVFNSISAAAWL